MYELSIFVLFVATLTDVNVRLLADANLAKDLFDVATLHKDAKSQIIVAHIGQGVATIVLACVEHALVLQQVIDDLERV